MISVTLKGERPELERKRQRRRTRRFSGLMSRCTMLRACRYRRALARLYTMALPSLSVYLVEEVIASKRSPPWRTCKRAHQNINSGRNRLTGSENEFTVTKG